MLLFPSYLCVIILHICLAADIDVFSSFRTEAQHDIGLDATDDGFADAIPIAPTSDPSSTTSTSSSTANDHDDYDEFLQRFKDLGKDEDDQ